MSLCEQYRAISPINFEGKIRVIKRIKQGIVGMHNFYSIFLSTYIPAARNQGIQKSQIPPLNTMLTCCQTAQEERPSGKPPSRRYNLMTCLTLPHPSLRASLASVTMCFLLCHHSMPVTTNARMLFPTILIARRLAHQHFTMCTDAMSFVSRDIMFT